MTGAVARDTQGFLAHVAASAAAADPGLRLDADVVPHRAGGARTILEFRFADGRRIFAKRYRRSEQALATHESLRSLWDGGFGAGCAQGVPEPLGCFPDLGVVLSGPAEGGCLETLADRVDPPSEGFVAAARWLATLHGCRLRLGPSEGLTDGVFFLAHRAVRATARHPELDRVVRRLLEELGRRAAALEDYSSTQRVPTHGEFQLRHVFIAPHRVTVIDLDRAALAGRAKDLGAFLHDVFLPSRGARYPHAPERCAAAFLDAYRSSAGTLPGGIPYWWSYSILVRILRTITREPDEWEARVEAFRDGFQQVPTVARHLNLPN